MTVESVVSAIAHRYGLKPQISEMLMDIKIDHADQTEESDISFLTRMAEMLGAITTVKSGNLLFIMPWWRERTGPAVALVRHYTQQRRSPSVPHC